MANTIDISPISYTNKDFRDIYEELLDLINDLTDRWDPKSTNESDPGLVLVKLKAFLADKLNYNIDKNTLENFPSQATQRGNAQKIYDILGYGMHYYESATTTVTMRYNKGENAGVYSEKNKGAYTIPAFTQLTDDNNTVNYFTTTDVQVPIEVGNQSIVKCEVMEGIIQDFAINGNTTITIDNLDSDYRLYFTESMIAQNGIFITTTTDSTYWQKVDNLESTQLGQKVFKFGIMPVTNTCYIEFPQDAANLFDDGINIKYTITTGSNGNISINVLNTIANTLEIDEIKELDSEGNTTTTVADLKNYTLIIQPYGTTSGKDPESLKSAYRNCQKIIDTFNTLVTIEDYQNAIYNSGTVSNCVVSDRTNDIRYSYDVVNKSINGNRVLHLNTGNTINKEFIPDMTAFDICIYAFKKVDNVYDYSSYNTSFETNRDTIENAKDAIENYKSIQHDYEDTINGDIIAILNLLSLDGKILTYKKITKLEAEEIEENIRNHLFYTYQSRNIDFGVPIDYNNLLNTIKEADERIKTVILEYPEYEPYAMFSDNSILSLNRNYNDNSNNKETINNLKATIIAKSILSGATPYFIFDNNQILDYTMTNVEAYYTLNKDKDINDIGNINVNNNPSTNGCNTFKKIAQISTSTEIESGKILTSYENIYCVGPSYVSKAQLSTCLYYAFVVNGSNGSEHKAYYINKFYKGTFNSDKLLYDYKQVSCAYYNNLTKDDEKKIIVTEVTEDIYNAYTTYNAINSKEDEQNDRTTTITIINSGEISNEDNTSNYDKYIKNIKIADKTISANSYYKLGEDEYLIAAENLDNDGYLNLSNYNSKKYWVYSGKDGYVVCPTMDISATVNPYANITTGSNYTKIKTKDNLGTSDTIDILSENKVQINSNNKKIYAVWSIENLYNQLFKEDIPNIADNDGYYKMTYLLQNNDVFIYTDEYKSDLMLLSSGTELEIRAKASNSLMQFASKSSSSSNIYWSMKNLDVNSINSKGLSASIAWNEIPINVEFWVAEKQIVALGEGTQISFTSNGKIGNEPVPINDFKYRYNNEEYQSLPEIIGDSNNSEWKAFSRLKLIVSPTQGQMLEDGQYILLEGASQDEDTNEIKYKKYNNKGELTDDNNAVQVLGPGQYITSNNIVALSGGLKQNAAVLTSDGELKIDLNLYISGKYSITENEKTKYLTTVSEIISQQLNSISQNFSVSEKSNYVEISLFNDGMNYITNNITKALEFNLPSSFNECLIPILFICGNDNEGKSIEISVSGATNINGSTSNNINGISNEKIYYFKRSNSNTGKLKITLPTNKIKSNAKLTLYNPLKIDHINKLLEVSSNIEKFNKLNIDGNFDYSYQIDEEDQIEDPLNPNSFFLPNHPYNRYTISKINTERDGLTFPHINIKVSNQSYQSTK